MGFISKQWLGRGQGLRNRKYHPEPIEPYFEPATDAWSRQRNVTVEVTMYKPDSNHRQELYLTEPEVAKAAEFMVKACNDEVRERIALQILKGLTDAQLLKLLATDLKSRMQQ